MIGIGISSMQLKTNMVNGNQLFLMIRMEILLLNTARSTNVVFLNKMDLR